MHIFSLLSVLLYLNQFVPLPTMPKNSQFPYILDSIWYCETFWMLLVRWLQMMMCCVNLPLIILLSMFVRVIRELTVSTRLQASASWLASATCHPPSTFTSMSQAFRGGRQARVWPEMCRRCVMLCWWPPVCPHPVSLQDCKAITNIDPSLLKCRLPSVYWLGTFKTTFLDEQKNTSCQKPLVKTPCFQRSHTSLLGMMPSTHSGNRLGIKILPGCSPWALPARSCMGWVTWDSGYIASLSSTS